MHDKIYLYVYHPCWSHKCICLTEVSFSPSEHWFWTLWKLRWKDILWDTCMLTMVSSNLISDFHRTCISKSSDTVSENVFHQALSSSFSYYRHRPRSRKKEETGPIMWDCIIYKFHAHVKDRNRTKFIIFAPTFQNYSHLYDSVIVSSIKLLE